MHLVPILTLSLFACVPKLAPSSDADTVATSNDSGLETVDSGDSDTDTDTDSDTDTDTDSNTDTAAPDADGDGYPATEDCDDTDPATHPDATEICADGLDQDCDGVADNGCGPSGAITLPDGVVLTGESPDDGFGTSVSGGGDVTGDGVDDLIIGAPGDDDGGSEAGALYVVPGPITSGSILDAASSKITFTVDGRYLGTQARIIGDTNGDGIADIAVDAPGWSGAWIILGSRDFPRSATLDSLETASVPTRGYGDASNLAMAADLDWDGDGLDDIFACTGQGGQWVVFGVKGDGSSDGEIGGEVYDISGLPSRVQSLRGAGDIDGDGLDDLLVGVTDTAYVFQATGGWSGYAGPGNAYATLTANAGDSFGTGVAGAGDVDGDGNVDVLVGASTEEGDLAKTGAAWLIAGPVKGTIIATGSFTDTVEFVGSDYEGDLGAAVEDAGDLDGDGHDDFLFGGGTNDGDGATDAGRVWLWRGPDTWGEDPGDAYATFTGAAAGDEAGWAISNGGDPNREGSPGIAIGAPGADGGTGAVYLVPAGK